MKRGFSSLAFGVLASVALALLLTGCASYHLGTGLPPEYRKIAIAEVQNLTEEARTTGLLRDRMAERLEALPGLSVVSEKHAGLLLSLRVKSILQHNVARTQARDSIDRHHDSDAYQTVLYRMVLTVEWSACPKGKSEVVRKGVATGTADMPLMPDREMAFQNAIQEAVRDVATMISVQLTEE